MSSLYCKDCMLCYFINWSASQYIVFNAWPLLHYTVFKQTFIQFILLQNLKGPLNLIMKIFTGVAVRFNSNCCIKWQIKRRTTLEQQFSVINAYHSWFYYLFILFVIILQSNIWLQIRILLQLRWNHFHVISILRINI